MQWKNYPFEYKNSTVRGEILMHLHGNNQLGHRNQSLSRQRQQLSQSDEHGGEQLEKTKKTRSKGR